jgi:microcystin-dependent protein
MAEPFLGEIRLMSFVYAPQGWALCNGQFLPINQNQPLFALLGTTFGGNGQTTFALPNFQGKVPIHVGSGHTLGETGGEQAHTLTIAELPTHTHALNAVTPVGTVAIPGPTTQLATSGNYEQYRSALTQPTTMQPGTVTSVGGSQAHLNMQPFLTLSFCIALQGIFPSPN